MSDSAAGERQQRQGLQPTGIEAGREAAKLLAEHHRERELFAASALRDLSRQTLQLSFAMNGGAIVAILTFIGAVAKTSDNITVGQFLWPLAFFAFGVGSSAVGTFSTFYNYRANFRKGYMQTIHYSKLVGSVADIRPEDLDPPPPHAAGQRVIDRTRRLAELGWAGSIIAFALGGASLFCIVSRFG